MRVIDASVWVSHLLEQDIHHAASRRCLAKSVNQGEIIIAPGLLLAEVAGAIARRSGEPRLGRRAVAHVTSTPGLRLIAGDPQLSTTAARLAADLRLRGPDAQYVAVAQHLDVPLVTWDKELLDRAGAIITTYSP